MKKFFTLIVAFISALGINAATEISLTGFSAWGDGITYDESTKTLDVTTAWTGGQFSVDVDASAAKYVMIKFTSCPIGLNVNYKGWWGDQLSIATSVDAGSEYLFTEITEADWSAGQYHIQQVQFQGQAVGQVVIDNVSLISQAEYDAIIAGSGIDPTAIWTGENDFGSSWAWVNSLGLAATTFDCLKSGESLVFEFSNSGSDNQFQIELGQWGGDGYLTYFDMVDNSYHCLSVKDLTTYEIPLTDDDITALKTNGLRVKGKDVTLTKIAHVTSTFSVPVYGDAQTIEYDADTHFIEAEQFDGLSPDAIVEFTYNTEGADGYVGWGPMAISSKQNQNADDAVAYSTGFAIKAEGENVVTCKLSDIADALNADYYPTTGKYGAYWCMWGFGDGACTNTRVSIKVYDCTNSTAEKFSANADGATTETITMSYDYATYIPQKALDFSEMTTIEAFVVTAVSDESVDLTKVYQVPAGTPIVVKGSTTDVPLAEYASEPETNLLTAATGTHIAVTGDYVLSVQDGVYGFYAAKAGTKITMGKAYLAAPSEAKVYTFNFGNDATAINAVKTVDAENGVAYNLAGQHINANAKGIVVKNGRKFIIK